LINREIFYDLLEAQIVSEPLSTALSLERW
jgi:hypothetical protein